MKTQYKNMKTIIKPSPKMMRDFKTQKKDEHVNAIYHLIEMLEELVKINTPISTSHEYDFPDYILKAKALIQKYKAQFCRYEYNYQFIVNLLTEIKSIDSNKMTSGEKSLPADISGRIQEFLDANEKTKL